MFREPQTTRQFPVAWSQEQPIVQQQADRWQMTNGVNASFSDARVLGVVRLSSKGGLRARLDVEANLRDGSTALVAVSCPAESAPVVGDTILVWGELREGGEVSVTREFGECRVMPRSSAGTTDQATSQPTAIPAQITARAQIPATALAPVSVPASTAPTVPMKTSFQSRKQTAAPLLVPVPLPASKPLAAESTAPTAHGFLDDMEMDSSVPHKEIAAEIAALADSMDAEASPAISYARIPIDNPSGQPAMSQAPSFRRKHSATHPLIITQQPKEVISQAVGNVRPSDLITPPVVAPAFPSPAEKLRAERTPLPVAKLPGASRPMRFRTEMDETDRIAAAINIDD